MKRCVFLFLVVCLMGFGSLAEGGERKVVKVGMNFKEAEALIEGVGGREAALDMAYIGKEDVDEEYYFLPDDRCISVTYKKPTGEIVHLSSFRINPEVPKGDPRHLEDIQSDAKEIELNKLNLIVQSDKKVYRSGEKMRLSVQFKNVSFQEALFNKYILGLKLREQIRFYDRYEGIQYKIIDTTKYKLPVIRPEDFISLQPGQDYEEILEIDTFFPEDEPYWYKKSFFTSEGIKGLPPGTYYISLKYENNVCGFFNNGMPIYDKNQMKADDRTFVGSLISNDIEIEIRKENEVKDDND